MALLDMADNRWRSQMVADLRKVMKLNRHNSLFKQGRIEDSLNEHRAILDAMLARDAEARHAMQAPRGCRPPPRNLFQSGGLPR